MKSIYNNGRLVLVLSFAVCLWLWEGRKGLILGLALGLAQVHAADIPLGPSVALDEGRDLRSTRNGDDLSPSLRETAAAAAGVFRLPADRQARPELQNVIIITAANAAYANHLTNLHCWLDRLGMRALLFALDPGVHRFAVGMSPSPPSSSSSPSPSSSSSSGPVDKGETSQARGGGATILSHLWAGAGAAMAGASARTGAKASKTTTATAPATAAAAGPPLSMPKEARYHTPPFHAITTLKLQAVLSVLRLLRYQVLFVDPDVALLRDPFPFLLWRGVDYVHSVNKICPQSDAWRAFGRGEEGNTGFYFVRSTNATIALFEAAIAESPRYPNLDDQTIFWSLVNDESRLRARGGPAITALDKCRDFNFDGLVFSRPAPSPAPTPSPTARARTRTAAAVSKSSQSSQGSKGNSRSPADAAGTLVQYSRRGRLGTSAATADAGGGEAADTGEGELVMCPLDGCSFSAGALRGYAYLMLERGLLAGAGNNNNNNNHNNRSSLVSVHANFLRGNALKVQALKRFGFWLVGSVHKSSHSRASLPTQTHGGGGSGSASGSGSGSASGSGSRSTNGTAASAGGGGVKFTCKAYHRLSCLSTPSLCDDNAADAVAT